MTKTTISLIKAAVGEFPGRFAVHPAPKEILGDLLKQRPEVVADA
jgi:fructose 1,6-bisphosphatase